MEFKYIYLVRHGKIQTDETQKTYIGQIDMPMCEEGKKQVHRLSSMLSGLKISAVYCSDLSRSVDTAKEIAGWHSIRPVIKPGLKEISLGEWEGMTFSEVIKLYPEEFRQRGADIANFCPPGGESFADCSTRVIHALQEIIRSSSGNIVISGHAGVNRMILCHALGMPVENLFNISQDYGCLNIIFAGNSQYRVTLLNETGSL